MNYFAEYAEKENDEATKSLSQIAKEFSVHLVAGSIPEEENGKYYNTCFIYNENGTQIGKFRKVSNLFLICILAFCMLINGLWKSFILDGRRYFSLLNPIINEIFPKQRVMHFYLIRDSVRLY